MNFAAAIRCGQEKSQTEACFSRFAAYPVMLILWRQVPLTLMLQLFGCSLHPTVPLTVGARWLGRFGHLCESSFFVAIAFCSFCLHERYMVSHHVPATSTGSVVDSAGTAHRNCGAAAPPFPKSARALQPAPHVCESLQCLHSRVVRQHWFVVFIHCPTRVRPSHLVPRF